jgi:hypothetical protein
MENPSSKSERIAKYLDLPHLNFQEIRQIEGWAINHTCLAIEYRHKSYGTCILCATISLNCFYDDNETLIKEQFRNLEVMAMSFKGRFDK